MPAVEGGRELDRLIAEQIMGWRYYASGYGLAAQRPYWVTPQGPFTADNLPRFSADVAAAWQVVQYLTEQGCDWRIATGWDQSSGTAGWQVSVVRGRPNERQGNAFAEVVPLAICRAALAAADAD
jgi:hypothetical protein